MGDSRRLLDDPVALRAVAHPVRSSLLGLLRREGPATATQLGRRLGESSGSASYHLRELERYGFVRDVPERGSARERWWEAAHRMTSWDTPGLLERDGGAEVVAELTHLQLRTQTRWLGALAAQYTDLDPEWQRATSLNDWALRLSPSSTRELVAELGAVLDRWMEREEEGQPVVSVLLDAFAVPEPPGPA